MAPGLSRPYQLLIRRKSAVADWQALFLFLIKK